MSPPAISDIASLIQAARQQAAGSSFRLPVVCSGERSWVQSQAAAQCGDAGELLWLGDGAPAQVEAQTFATARTWLGRELDVVVINAFSGLDVDGLGAVSGTIRAGGMLMLLTPPLDQWQYFPDPEHAKLAVAGYDAKAVSGYTLGRLARLIREDGQLLLIEQNRPLPAVPKFPPSVGQGQAAEPYATNDQQQAVEKILSVLQQDKAVPLVMTADRGRGKSAALGLAAGQLLQQKNIRIGIAGPRLAAVEQVFVYAAKLCPEAAAQRNRIHLSHSRLDYFAPDELIREQPKLDVLFVDEAAAIPAPMLARLLELYPRIVFSSTLHGYEGSGRGFALRFRQTLDERAPGWQSIELAQPVRWAAGDALEQWIFRALLLDVELQPALPGTIDLQALTFHQLSPQALLQNETLLRELFALLVWAHYQTRPQDLRNLLDGPNVEVVVAESGGQLLGAMLISLEGGFDATTAEAIVRGQRRPRGHLVPQSLALHAGFVEAAQLRYARVMRIAVHPQRQRRGVGAALLHWLATSMADRVDLLCASFGATPELLNFWQGQGYRSLRLGFSRDQASGTHSVIVARGISVAGEALVEVLATRLAKSLPLLLRDGLAEVEPALVQRLQTLPTQGAMSAQDWRDVRAFAAGERGYESCLLGLWRFLHSLPPELESLSPEHRNLLKEKLFESSSWQNLVVRYGFVGRAAAIKELEQIIATLIKSYE